MQNHYRFNVSKNGLHFFATAEHSVTDANQAKRVGMELMKRFPESEGFKVDCTFWEASGKEYDFALIAKNVTADAIRKAYNEQIPRGQRSVLSVARSLAINGEEILIAIVGDETGPKEETLLPVSQAARYVYRRLTGMALPDTPKGMRIVMRSDTDTGMRLFSFHYEIQR